jgi:hypothetical protein
VFGDGGGQVVIGNLARHAAQRRKRMHVTTDEGFEALAVGKLQVQHAAVRFDQGEGVELALVPRIIQHAEVPPGPKLYICPHLSQVETLRMPQGHDFEALAGRRLHPQEGAAGFQLGAHRAHRCSPAAAAVVP